MKTEENILNRIIEFRATLKGTWDWNSMHDILMEELDKIISDFSASTSTSTSQLKTLKSRLEILIKNSTMLSSGQVHFSKKGIFKAMDEYASQFRASDVETFNRVNSKSKPTREGRLQGVDNDIEIPLLNQAFNIISRCKALALHEVFLPVAIEEWLEIYLSLNNTTK